MVLISDGYLEIGAHVNSNLFKEIDSAIIIISPKRNILRAHHNLRYHLIKVLWPYMDKSTKLDYEYKYLEYTCFISVNKEFLVIINIVEIRETE